MLPAGTAGNGVAVEPTGGACGMLQAVQPAVKPPLANVVSLSASVAAGAGDGVGVGTGVAVGGAVGDGWTIVTPANGLLFDAPLPLKLQAARLNMPRANSP
jgi:hypothetical protein